MCTLPQFSNVIVTYAYEIVMRYVTEGENDVKYTMIRMKDKNQYKHLVEFLK